MKSLSGYGPRGYVQCNACHEEVPEISKQTEPAYRLCVGCRPEKIAKRLEQAEQKAAQNVDRPKRGPGRPRKSPVPVPQATDQPKRKRGRPRIHPLPDPQVPAQPKRKRGRPRKNPVKE